MDIISQHFFNSTPAYFALSYISLYLDYHYPLGGTGQIVDKMVAFIKEHGGDIKVSSKRSEGTTFTIILPKHKQELAKP